MKDYTPQGLSGWDSYWDDMSKARKKAFEAAATALANDIGKAYGTTLRDLQVAMDGNASAIQLIKNIRKSERGPALKALAKSVAATLKQRDAKWNGIGRSLAGKLTSIVTGGLG